MAGIESDYQSDSGFPNDTPYLALAGELWDVFCEYLWENWPRYSGTALWYVTCRSIGMGAKVTITPTELSGLFSSI